MTEQLKKTVREHCDGLGWNATDLMRHSEITWKPAKKAFCGEQISHRIKKDICRALSSALETQIGVGDIRWD